MTAPIDATKGTHSHTYDRPQRRREVLCYFELLAAFRVSAVFSRHFCICACIMSNAKKARYQWRTEDMALAVESVKSGMLSLRAASKPPPGGFGVPLEDV